MPIIQAVFTENERYKRGDDVDLRSLTGQDLVPLMIEQIEHSVKEGLIHLRGPLNRKVISIPLSQVRLIVYFMKPFPNE